MGDVGLDGGREEELVVGEVVGEEFVEEREDACGELGLFRLVLNRRLFIGECKTGFKDSDSLVKRIGKGRFPDSDS